MIPLFLSLYYVVIGKVDKAFLNVYLPCLILVPHYFTFVIPHLPHWSASEGALMPIALSLVARPASRWRLHRMDVWVFLFIVSAGVSEITRENNWTNGLFVWLTEFVQMFLVYVVARQVIEPGMRAVVAKRIVFLMVCMAPFILMEYVTGRNPWLSLSDHLFGVRNSGWFEQMRGGHARVAASYGQAILAGMVFMGGFALNYFLVQIYKVDKARLGKWMSMLQKYRLPFLLLPLFLYLTGSRGPLVCIVLCFLVMQIPRFKNIKTGVAVVVLVLAVGGSVLYNFYQRYTSVQEGQVADEQQSSAMYRRELLANYAPILEAGGWLGYGALSHPQAAGQGSIDNYYMLVQLAQGKLGVYLFEIVAFDSIFSLGQLMFKFKTRETLFLGFCLMGALAALFVTLRTVYMGEQVPEMLFLMLGWSQSLQDVGPANAGAWVPAVQPKFRFRRVIA
jgi:hypothetical protein